MSYVESSGIFRRGRRNALRVLLALSLTLGLFAGSVTSGPALFGHNDEDLFFPWVPNGTMLGESGPYYGAITIQNLEDVGINVFAAPKATLELADPPMLFAFQIAPLGSLTFTLAELGVGDEILGSGVVVQTSRQSDGQPALVAGVMKQSAPLPPENGTTGDDHLTVAGYTALPHDQIGEQVVFPIAQSNNGWDTVFRTTNFSNSDPATISIQFFEAGTGANFGGTSEQVGPGQTWTYSVLQSQIGAEWVGSAIITSDQPIGAIAERVKPETNMLIINSAALLPEAAIGSPDSIAPLILREWNHWNTGISVVNLANLANEVSVTYYASDGTLIDTENLSLPPRGMDFIFTPSLPESEEEGFVGSAIIQSEHPVYGATDQVKYLGEDDDTGHAMSYMIKSDVAGTGDHLTMPLYQKGDPELGGGDTSGIQVFNPSAEPASGLVYFYDEQGNQALNEPIEIELGSHQGETIYAMFYPELTAGFHGSAIIHVLSGQLIGASNNVNYDVQYDGSASFNLPVVTGLLEPYSLVITASPNPVPHFQLESRATVTITDRFGTLLPIGGVWFTVDMDIDVDYGQVDVDELGRRYVDFVIQESALGDRPGTVTVGATLDDTDLEDEVTITWQAPPELAPPP